MSFYSIPTENALQDQLGATLAAGAVSLTTSTDISAKLPDASATTPGLLVIDRVDASAVATPTKREYISFTGVSGTTISGITRGLGGSSDQEHASGAVIEFVPDVDWAIGVYDTFLTEHGSTGVHGVVTATSIELGGAGVVADGIKDEDDMVSDSATALASQQSIKAYATPTDGWVASGDTWTYASASTFTIAGVNRTTTYTKGTKIKCTNSTVKYFIVKSSAFSTNTTVTVTGGSDYALADAAITANYYSYVAKPQGFPQYFNYTPVATPGGSMTFGSFGIELGYFQTAGSVIWCFVRLQGTIGGTPNAQVDISLPIDMGISSMPFQISEADSVVGWLKDTGGTSTVRLTRQDGAVWTAGTRTARFCFVYNM